MKHVSEVLVTLAVIALIAVVCFGNNILNFLHAL